MNVPVLIMNLLLAILIAPIFDGLRRKVTARLQNRIGPPITQTWYDILKLLRKETIMPETGGFLVLVFPILTLVLSLAMFATISTITVRSPVERGGIIFIELAVLSAFALAMAGSTSRNPYGIVGGSREVILATLVEPSIIVSLAALILSKGSATFDDISRNYSVGIPLLVAIIAYFLSLLAESGRVPFDVAEAESELSGGPLIEFSGPPLAFIKLSQSVRSIALYSIPKFFIIGLIPLSIIGGGYSATVAIVYFASLLLCTLIISLAESLNARYRILEASKFYGIVLAISSLALILSILSRSMG
jgi:formate hydrogenlyase subunit 4